MMFATDCPDYKPQIHTILKNIWEDSMVISHFRPPSSIKTDSLFLGGFVQNQMDA